MKMVQLTGVMQQVLIPYLEAIDMLHFAMLNKACLALLDLRSPRCVNYKMLLKQRGCVVSP